MKAVKSITVTALPWVRAGDEESVGSCLAQSCNARTGYGGRSGVRISYFFDVRISSRSGVFFDDISDHEFENSATMAPWIARSSAGVTFKYLKSRRKTDRSRLLPARLGVSNFALENDLKALAFCAARSHIVAVR
jgi:hypothetical protein